MDISLMIPEIFSIFFNGLSSSTRDNQQNDVILITGPKGVGKTQLVKLLAYLHHQRYPKDRVIISCEIKDLYNDLAHAIKVDLDEIAKRRLRNIMQILVVYQILLNSKTH
jgi:predicted AAA+ superfamily ATPase